jgi:predicted ATP-dependent serine protease
MTEKRCNRCKIVIDGKYKSCDECREFNRLRYTNLTPEAKHEIRAGYVYRYRTDEAWRKQKNLEVATRSKALVVCSECDKVLRYGSLKTHIKCCRGRTEKTTLDELLELSLQVCPLIESNDCVR